MQFLIKSLAKRNFYKKIYISILSHTISINMGSGSHRKLLILAELMEFEALYIY